MTFEQESRTRGESIAPKPKLLFGEAAEIWLNGPVLDLRETTQAKYRCMVNEHLAPRFSARRLDGVSADDLAVLVRELRAEGRVRRRSGSFSVSLAGSISSRLVDSGGAGRSRRR